MEKQEVGQTSWPNPDTRPSFYQIMWLQNLIQLRIPTEFFNDHLETEEAEVVTLNTPCGSWDAEMERRDDGIYLVRGWQDFVERHSLGRAEFAVFIYNGGMSFDVRIYGSQGWLKNYEAVAAPQEPVPPFTLSFPFFRHEMKSSNVGHQCTMRIPKAFTKKYLLMTKGTMMLRDSDGISWAVSTIITSSGDLCLCGGWKAFTDACSIKKGDVCIFELVEQKLMQVHILR